MDTTNTLGTTGTTAKGGCGFYANKVLNYIEKKDLNFKFKANDEECKSFCVELLNLNSPNTLLGVIYRHPSKNDTTVYWRTTKNSNEN